MASISRAVRNRCGISPTAAITALVAIAIIILAVVGVVTSQQRPIGPSIPHETTTIFVSKNCSSTTAVTHGNSTTTYVRTFVGNLTVMTTIQGFSTNATQVCK